MVALMPVTLISGYVKLNRKTKLEKETIFEQYSNIMNLKEFNFDLDEALHTMY